MESQHWFREWLDAIRQQAITWANVDSDGITGPQWVNCLRSKQNGLHVADDIFKFIPLAWQEIYVLLNKISFKFVTEV